MPRVTKKKKNTKENKEPKPVSPGWSKAINKKTPVKDKSDTKLNKINSIPSYTSLSVA